MRALSSVLSCGLIEEAQGTDIDALLDALPAGEASQALHSVISMPSLGPEAIAQGLSGFHFQHHFDAAIAAHDAVAAGNA